MQENNERIIKLNNKKQAQSVYDVEELSVSLSANGGGQGGKTGLYSIGDGKYTPTLTSMGTTNVPLIRKVKNVGKLHNYQRGNVMSDEGLCQTLTKCDYKDPLKIETNYKIRRLTPVECERLQGFSDDYTKYGRDGELISDSQRYKCLGNAVTVNVVEYIMNNWDLKGE